MRCWDCSIVKGGPLLHRLKHGALASFLEDRALTLRVFRCWWGPGVQSESERRIRNKLEKELGGSRVRVVVGTRGFDFM